jgi:hypothetical protein
MGRVVTLSVSDPYPNDRVRGMYDEPWLVRVSNGVIMEIHRFTTEAEARAFAARYMEV